MENPEVEVEKSTCLIFKQSVLNVLKNPWKILNQGSRVAGDLEMNIIEPLCRTITFDLTPPPLTTITVP